MKGLIFSIAVAAVLAIASGTAWYPPVPYYVYKRETTVGRLPGFLRCYTTGCAPKGLPAYCPKDVIEVARKTCISGFIDATCCVPEKGSGGPPAPPSPPHGGNNGGRSGHNPTKGYWDPSHPGCSWTGCAPKGLQAFCPAATKESGTKQCDDQGLIDVKCCL